MVSVRGVSKLYLMYNRPQDRLKQMLWRGPRMFGREFWALRTSILLIHGALLRRELESITSSIGY